MNKELFKIYLSKNGIQFFEENLPKAIKLNKCIFSTCLDSSTYPFFDISIPSGDNNYRFLIPCDFVKAVAVGGLGDKILGFGNNDIDFDIQNGDDNRSG